MGAKQKARLYLLIASLQAVMVAFLVFLTGSSATVSAAAGVNSQLSFEGKIVKADGTNITNGTYNMEFKIYQDGTNTGSGSTLKWTEDRLVGGSGGVTLTDGTFQVNLGSVNPFGSQVDWNQDTLWLSMQIGNSSSCTISTTFQTNCSGDGEMTPFIRLTAVPYANNAAALGGIAASGFIQNSTNPQTANFNVVSGNSGNVTATIQGASGQSVDIAEIKVNGVANPVFKVASNGSSTFRQATGNDSTTAFQVQNSSGGSLINVDSQYSNITLLGNNDGQTGPWINQASNLLPAARDSATSVTANGYVYVLGGYDGSFAKNTVFYAKLNTDGSTGPWTNQASNLIPNALENATSIVANGYIYVIGGIDFSGTFQNTVFYAKLNTDGSTGPWTQASNSLPAIRAVATSVTANGYVYVLGGDANGTLQNTVFYAKLNADGSTGPWTNQVSNLLPSARYYATSVTANGYVYVLGGGNGAVQNTVFYAKLNADGSTGPWTNQASNLLPSASEAATSVTANGYVYVLGGVDATLTRKNTVFYAKLNADGSTGPWTNQASNLLPAALEYSTSIMANGYIYTFGGVGGTNTVFYSSLARLKVGGSLDLVGSTSTGTLSDSGAGGSLTAGNTQIVGSLQVQNVGTFTQSLAVGGNLTVAGDQNVSNISLGSTGNANATIRKNMIVTGAVNANDVVIIDSANIAQVKQSDRQSGSIFGIATAAAASGPASQDIVTYGVYQVNLSTSAGSITTGDSIDVAGSSDPGKVTTAGCGITKSVGHALESKTAGAGGLLWVFVNPGAGQSSGSCASPVTTLQTVYSASSSPQISLSQSNGGLKIQDASTPITGSDLFDVQSNAGGTKFLAVSSANSGTVTVGGRLYTPNLDSASGVLTIGNNNATAVNIGNTTNNIATTINGTVLVKPTATHDSTTAFQVQNSGGGSLLTVDSQNNQVITTNLAAQSVGTVLMNNSVVLGTVPSFGASSVTVDGSGIPRVVYKDASDNLIFAQCTVQSCAAKTTTTIANISFSQDVSLAMGSDGFARIAYYDYTNGDLLFVQCTNAACSTDVSTTVDSLNNVGHYVSLAMGQDGFARMAYKDSTSNDLRYVQCTNAACTSNVITIVDSTDSVGSGASITLGSDGFARISYYDSTANSIKLAQCTNAACSTNVITTIAGSFSGTTSVAMGTDDYPVIAYIGSDFDLYIAKCTNASCSTNTITKADPNGNNLNNLSIKIGSDGYPKVSYNDATGSVDLHLLNCTSADCSTSSLITVDSTGGVGSFSSLATAANGYMYISYADGTNSNMKLAQLFLPGPLGSSLVQGSTIGTSGSPFGQIYAKAIDLGGTLTVNGTGITNIKPLYDSSSLLQIQTALGTNLLTVDSVNKQVNLIAAKPLTAISVAVTADSTIIAAGDYSLSSTLGADGYDRIVQLNSGIKYYKCLNTNCTSKTTSTIAGPSCGSSADTTAIAIAPDGFARIAYYDCNTDNLKYIQCTNDLCSSNVANTIDATAGVGQTHIAMAMGADGFARIVYHAAYSGDLKFAQCTNAACSTPVVTTVDSTNAVGSYPAITMATDGFARISYRDDTNGYLKFAQCTNAACSTNVITTVDTGVYSSTRTDWGTSDIVMGTGDFPAISYYGFSGNYLQLLQCTNASCTTNTKNNIDTGIVGGYSSMAINGSGTFYISYYDDWDKDLRLAMVTSGLSISISTLDSSGDVGSYTSLSLSSSGKAQIAYYDATNFNIKYVIQNSSRAAVSGSDLGSLTSRFGNIYVGNINSNYFSLQPSTDTTTAFQIKNSSGVTLFNADTINNSVSIASPINSTTAFQVQNSTGTQIFNVDTSSGTITIGASSNTVAITSTAGIVLSGSARHQKNIILIAEYPGAVMTPTSGNGHSGSMTSDFDVTNFHNYYDWTSTTAGNDYDIFVRVPVPDDFSAWNGVGTVRVWGTAATTSATVAVYDTNNTLICTSSNLISAAGIWQTPSSCDYTASGTWSASGVMTLRLRLTATAANDHARVSNIKLPYYSKW